jgi:hypothetical protein
MQSLYVPGMVDAVFDDPNLVADAGLVPLTALAEDVGLPAGSRQSRVLAGQEACDGLIGASGVVS